MKKRKQIPAKKRKENILAQLVLKQLLRMLKLLPTNKLKQKMFNKKQKQHKNQIGQLQMLVQNLNQMFSQTKLERYLKSKRLKYKTLQNQQLENKKQPMQNKLSKFNQTQFNHLLNLLKMLLFRWQNIIFQKLRFSNFNKLIKRNLKKNNLIKLTQAIKQYKYKRKYNLNPRQKNINPQLTQYLKQK
ncbi:Hypothetical_protein [Hexamita inflata]|uniref:Hypothetical_protein n=1 Tax=Hexamita inflata TaxID=28002 RepID=A0AA86UBX2_9EUKA|nr:Hypothetical protein HINF_LOCUS32762 [Hexamita inflata]